MNSCLRTDLGISFSNSRIRIWTCLLKTFVQSADHELTKLSRAHPKYELLISKNGSDSRRGQMSENYQAQIQKCQKMISRKFKNVRNVRNFWTLAFSRKWLVKLFRFLKIRFFYSHFGIFVLGEFSDIFGAIFWHF